jgi:hypothetical protein
MRHRDGDTPVAIGQGRYAERRAVRIERILRRDTAIVIHVTIAHEAAVGAGLGSGWRDELRIAFTVCDGDGEDGARHAIEHDGR